MQLTVVGNRAGMPADGAGVDIFLAECTLAEPDRTEHGHLSATEVGRAAAEFDGPVAIARPNMVFTVPADVRT